MAKHTSTRTENEQLYVLVVLRLKEHERHNLNQKLYPLVCQQGIWSVVTGRAWIKHGKEICKKITCKVKAN